MANKPRKNRRLLRIGCIGTLCLLGLSSLIVAAVAWQLWHMVPGEGRPGTDAFEAWMAEHHPADPAAEKSLQRLHTALAIYSAEQSKFRTEMRAARKPPNWPNNASFPIDFETASMTGCPAVVQEAASEFAARLELAGFPNALDSATKVPSFAAPVGSDRFASDIPEFPASRFNIRRMSEAARQGDEAGVVAVFDSSMALAQVSDCQPNLFARTVSGAITEQALASLRTAMVELSFSDATLRECQRVLDHRSEDSLQEIRLASERANLIDLIHQMCADDADGSGRPVLQVRQYKKPRLFNPLSLIPEWLESYAESPIVNIGGSFSPSKLERQTRLDAMFTAFAAYATQSMTERRVNGPPLLFKGEERRFPFLYATSVSLERTIIRDSARDSQLTGTRLMLAIERHRAAHGTPPQSLDQLVPEFLTALPLDPWTSTPFGYKLLPAPDEFGRRYILYSYGSNLKDDGGVYNEHQQSLSESETDRASTHDFILNAPRPRYQPRP